MLPDGFPVVELEYLTEPPHGDFLYLLLRRDIQLSLCSRFLAITSLHAHGSNAMAFHVVDLMERKIWSRSGFADLLSNYGEATQVPLRTDEWASYVRS